jgi:hypothetical protein
VSEYSILSPWQLASTRLDSAILADVFTQPKGFVIAQT